MKKFLFVAAGAAAVVVAFFMFAPESRVTSVKQAWARLTGDPGQVCFDQYKDKLKDPDSAMVAESHASEGRVYVTYRATNSFGTYMRGSFDCPLDKSGKVDTIATFGEQSAAIGRRADAVLRKLQSQ